MNIMSSIGLRRPTRQTVVDVAVDRSRNEVKVHYRRPEIRFFMALHGKRNLFSF
jgi:hypothetical protein